MRYFATAKITTPSLALAEKSGGKFDQGAIWVECPELNFVGENLLYCRYGLSLPYIKVKVGDKLWIEPTVGRDERWIYTGFADCAGRYTLTDNNNVLLESANAFILQVENAKVYLQRAKDNAASENVVLGQKLKTSLSTILGALSSALDALDTACSAFTTHIHGASPVPDGASIAAFSSASTACGNTKTTVDAEKLSPVDDELMLSDFLFTEK